MAVLDPSYTWMGPRPWERTHANFTETRYWDTHDGTVKPLYDPLGRLLGVRTTDEGTGGTNLGDFAGFRYGWDRVGNLMFEQRLHEPLSAANTYRGSRKNRLGSAKGENSPLRLDLSELAGPCSFAGTAQRC